MPQHLAGAGLVLETFRRRGAGSCGAQCWRLRPSVIPYYIEIDVAFARPLCPHTTGNKDGYVGED